MCESKSTLALSKLLSGENLTSEERSREIKDVLERLLQKKLINGDEQVGFDLEKEDIKIFLSDLVQLAVEDSDWKTALSMKDVCLLGKYTGNQCHLPAGKVGYPSYTNRNGYRFGGRIIEAIISGEDQTVTLEPPGTHCLGIDVDPKEIRIVALLFSFPKRSATT